ncbi:hypothetical protein GXW82_19550 [Streptacidiphilus sp. 4-A2]|nr:hypothetical protein [Streptacidiphilus sp. 4-A2]
MLDCRDRAARFEVLRVVAGSDPARCVGVPGAELAYLQPATARHPATEVCVTLLDVQSRAPGVTAAPLREVRSGAACGAGPPGRAPVLPYRYRRSQYW